VPTPQTIYALMLCAAGGFAIAVSHYQVERREIGKVQLISPRGKHLIGLLCVFVAIVLFVGQFVMHR
jgi:hypothetical protein